MKLDWYIDTESASILEFDIWTIIYNHRSPPNRKLIQHREFNLYIELALFRKKLVINFIKRLKK